jgi:hypothetical protein
MGVDPGLVDAAAKVPFDSGRFMTADEIRSFGVETNGTYETGWFAFEDSSKKTFVLKSITRPNDTAAKEYRTTRIGISCVGAGFGIRLQYRRELMSNEISAETTIRVAAGPSRCLLRGGRIRSQVEEQGALVSRGFFRDALASPHIVVSESFAPHGSGGSWSRETRLSTEGLMRVSDGLRADCGRVNAPGAVGR